MSRGRDHGRVRARESGLRPWAERATRAVIEAVFARPGDQDGVRPPSAERVDWVCSEVEDFLARVSTRSYVVVIVSLVVVSVVAPLLARRISALASLGLEERIRALTALEESGLAPALLAIKALLAMFYYEHPDAAREVGFDGACALSAPARPIASEARAASELR